MATIRSERTVKDSDDRRGYAWPEEKNAEFRQMWIDGKTIAEIMRRFGMTEHAVRNRRSALGLDPRGTGNISTTRPASRSTSSEALPLPPLPSLEMEWPNMHLPPHICGKPPPAYRQR